MTLRENKVRIPSDFAISSLLPCVRNMPPETRTLITFANYSNPSSSFVNIKVSVYTGIIPCFIPPNDNLKLKQTFAQYGVHTPRLDLFWKQRTSKSSSPGCNVRPMCCF